MNTEKLYGIRLRHYEYGDDYNYFSEDYPQYLRLCSDHEEALTLLDEMEAIECLYLNSINQSLDYFIGTEGGPDSIWMKRDEIIPKVKNLYKKYFDIEVPFNEDNWIDEIGLNLAIPRTAKLEQVNEIRKLLKINFYNIYEFESKVNAVVYKVVGNDQFSSKHLLGFTNQMRYYHEHFDIDHQFLDKEEALNTICANLRESIGYALMTAQSTPEFPGSLDQLSKTPSILQALLEQSVNFSYDATAKKITIEKVDYQTFIQDFKTLLELLIDKPFTIVETPLKDK